jgi:hypothetical protein
MVSKHVFIIWVYNLGLLVFYWYKPQMSGSTHTDCMIKCMERYARAVRASGARLTAWRRSVISVLCSFEC